jgi:hypothetical protein
VWVSAKQNYAFCFFFWENKGTMKSIGFLGPAPDPVAPLRGEMGMDFLIRVVKQGLQAVEKIWLLRLMTNRTQILT